MGVVTPLPGCTAARSKTVVLAVDDDPQVLRVLLRILDPTLYQVETAMTEAEAVRLAEETSPVFVLLDLHLSHPPRADGSYPDLKNSGINIIYIQCPYIWYSSCYF